MATAYDIIIRPVITERAMAGAADKKYVFEVARLRFARPWRKSSA